MRTLISVIIVVFCLQLWAQVPQSTTIIDSVYAIPELDGNITADSLGIPISTMSWTFEFRVGDIGRSNDLWLNNGTHRGYVSFPLPSIPEGYSLVNATMRLYQYTSLGNIPLSDSTYVSAYFPVWNVIGGDTIKCIVSHVDYGSSLDLGDWAKGDEGNPYTYNPNVGEITWQGIDEPNSHGEAGYRYLDITDCVLYDLAIGSIFSQYRIAFQINTDYDNGPDFVAFLSANSNPDYPEFLPIIYYTLFNPSSVSDDLSPGILNEVTTSPNPFVSQLQIDLSLRNNAEVTVQLYDMKGRLVKKLNKTTYAKGTHSIDMGTSGLCNGIYLLQVKAGSEIITKKVTCLK